MVSVSAASGETNLASAAHSRIKFGQVSLVTDESLYSVLVENYLLRYFFEWVSGAQFLVFFLL